MSNEKRELRRLFAARRDGLFSDARSKRIAEVFLASPMAQAESFFVYLSFRSEADTAFLVGALRARDKLVCAPRLDGRTMLAAPLGEERVKNAYGIEEPAAGEDMPCAVTVAPLLAFDACGYRLGYGGGYYDRYFASHPQTYRVGLAFAGQRGEFPVGRGDVPLDAVVTEDGIIYTGKPFVLTVPPQR